MAYDWPRTRESFPAFAERFFAGPHVREWLLPWTTDDRGYESTRVTRADLDRALVVTVNSPVNMGYGQSSATVKLQLRVLFVPLMTLDHRYVVGHVFEDKLQTLKYCSEFSDGLDGEAQNRPPDVLTYRFWMDLNDFGRLRSCLVRSDRTVEIGMTTFSRDFGIVHAEAALSEPTPQGQLPSQMATLFVVSRMCSFCEVRGEHCECNLTSKYRIFGLLEHADSFGNLTSVANGHYEPGYFSVTKVSGPIVASGSFRSSGSSGEPSLAQSGGIEGSYARKLLNMEANSLGPGNRSIFLPSCRTKDEFYGQLGYQSTGLTIRHQSPVSLTADDSNSLLSKISDDQDALLVEGKSRKLSTANKKRLPRRFDRSNHVCPECGKGFNQKGHLSTHVETVHHRIRKHSCDLCDSAFVSVSNLNRHLKRTHQRLCDFHCNRCTREFYTELELNNHVTQRHTVKERH